MERSEKIILLFENFFAREEADIMNPLTSKKVRPSTKYFIYDINIDVSDPAFTKLIRLMNQERNGTVAWSPYVRQKFEHDIPRGDNTLLQGAFQKAQYTIRNVNPQ
jgi:hypothetical protein